MRRPLKKFRRFVLIPTEKAKEIQETGSIDMGK